ncbi:MAG: DNRLRE domain-containing protein [Verrucomicrobiota bacterium JB024]|nr:DNRLRE domain-containing protein [Verrucomicrobiota bacterium JB024]
MTHKYIDSLIKKLHMFNMNKNLSLSPLLLLFVACLSLPHLSSGQVDYSFQQGFAPTSGGDAYTGTSDTYLTGTTLKNVNYGGQSNAFVGMHTNGQLARSLIRFSDLDSVLTSGDAANISSVTLTLRIGSPAAQTQDVEVLVYAVDASNAAWIQGSGMGGAIEVGAAAWKSLATGTDGNDSAPNRVQWDGGEGLGNPGDGYGSTFIDSFTVLDGTDSYYNISLPVTLVQSWITDPSSNAGLLLRVGDEETLGNVVIFSTSEAPTAVFRPELTITVVPEVSGMSFSMGLAVLLVMSLWKIRKKVSTRACN